jgi:hypothetical protein
MQTLESRHHLKMMPRVVWSEKRGLKSSLLSKRVAAALDTIPDEKLEKLQ